MTLHSHRILPMPINPKPLGNILRCLAHGQQAIPRLLILKHLLRHRLFRHNGVHIVQTHTFDPAADAHVDDACCDLGCHEGAGLQSGRTQPVDCHHCGRLGEAGEEAGHTGCFGPGAGLQSVTDGDVLDQRGWDFCAI
jgi:hypothetical protein